METEKPQVFQSNALTEETKNSKKNAMVPKLIFGLLGLIIVIELFIGAKTLLQPIPVIGKVGGFDGGKIALIAPQNSYKVGDSVPVMIRISTGGHNSDGADVNLKYDPNYLTASTGSFSKGMIYSDFPIVSVDTKTGTVKVSGIVGPGLSSFNGIGELGILTFKVLKEGKTSVAVDYQPNTTTHSTIIENTTAKNVLDQVYNLDLNINNSVTGISPKACSARTFQMCRDSNGRIGTYWCSGVQDSTSCNNGCFKTQTGNELGCKVVTSGQ